MTHSSSDVAPLFSVVTPVMNGATYLAETIESVLTQTLADFEYVILDAGSTDGSREIIRAYAEKDSRIHQVFERDGGMYDAILKGFSLSRGKFCCWINSDDKLMPWALESAASALTTGNAKWVTGIPALWDPNGTLAWVSRPKSHPRMIIKLGLCHGRGWGFIQQESTFFTRELLEAVPPSAIETIRNQRLAGDFLLWVEFGRLAPIHPLPTILAGFRVHGENMSSAIDQYYDEIRTAGFPVPGRFARFFLKLAALLSDIRLGLRQGSLMEREQIGWRARLRVTASRS